MRMNERLVKAKEFATKAHEGQVRKSTGTPMISHPIRVAKMLQDYGFEPEVVAAGYLHDVVEDTSYTLENIVAEFGEDVARVVAGNTEDKSKTWEERKAHTIEHIKTAPLEVKALIVADKLDNLSCLIEDYERFGEDLWNHFKRGKDQQKWYFESVAENAMFGLKNDEIPEFFHTYQEKVKTFFRRE